MKVLSLGIHPDDADFGTGGYLLLLSQAGWETVILDLTEGERSTNGTVEERRDEAKRSAGVLGLSKRLNCRLPDCGIDRSDSGQLVCVVRQFRAERPDLLLVPYWEDDHPDHIEGSHLATRARYTAGLVNYLPEGGEPYRIPTVLYYPCRKTFKPTFIVDISSVFEEKERAARCFESQVILSEKTRSTPLNSPLFLDRLRARSVTLGATAGVDFGEAYLATEPFLLNKCERLAPGRW